jgi:serine-type D-Ala-D-Ala carboxypeptidase (penicillin-binding protein 5/6)
MSLSTLARPTTTTTRRRRSTAVVTGLSLLVAAAPWWPGPLGWGKLPAPHTTLNTITIRWSPEGQSALAIRGAGQSNSGAQTPVPIASVAKVMTAYVVLRGFPLRAGQPGFTVTFSNADVAEAAADKASGQSYVPVQAGEVMTERQALTALLLPSANNIAHALADHVAGSESGFVRAMNDEAADLHLRDTTYTDPSGLDPDTTSTAVDQLRLARAAMRIPAFAGIVGLPLATIPVVGPVSNTDTLLGHDGFVGIKTGSTSAAGGCFMFAARQRLRGKEQVVTGVVLGQRGGPLIHAALDAAQDLVDGVMSQVAAA